MKKIGFLGIGNELLNGTTREGNAYTLAQYLAVNGHKLEETRIIADTKEALILTINELSDNLDFLFITGGLGPTKDDLTKKLIADYYQKNLIYQKEIEEFIRPFYEKRGRLELLADNAYCLVPEKFQYLKNDAGLAPGMYFYDEKKDFHLFIAAGVPQEFKTLLEGPFHQILKSTLYQNDNQEYKFFIKTTGIAEEEIFNKLCPTLWDDLERFGTVSSLPQNYGVNIGVRGKISDIEKSKIIEIVKKTPLDPFVWHYGNQTIEEVVFNMAIEKKITIAVAESCTCGSLSNLLTQISGSSVFFLGGIVAYANEAKEKILKVQSQTIQKHGAVSSETALEMALGLKNIFNSHYAVATTGIAGPTGGSSEKPVGTIWISTVSADKQLTRKYHFRGDRESLKRRFSYCALHQLLETMEKK